MDRRYDFADVITVLMLVQAQMLAVDRRFGLAGIDAGLMLVQV